MLRGSNTAVYAGLMAADYEHLMGRDENTLGPYHVTGTSRALLSNRISYFFRLARSVYDNRYGVQL